jgi:redox-sensing transcriptional repressor
MAKAKDRHPKASGDTAVPKAVVARLSLYLRQLERFVKQQRETVSSSQLGKALGITDAQVRKDLAYFGQFGYPGIGYRTEELAAGIRRILGTDQSWPVALVGVGNLGRALTGYRGFPEQSFKIAALFDSDPKKVGSTYEGHTVYGLDESARVIAEQAIKLAIIAVPADSAQEVADDLVAAGIQGILNFAPTTLTVPARVNLVVVDLTVQLEQLSFLVTGANKRAGE